MHHKRRRPKSGRRGCLFCKSWKHQNAGKRRLANRRISDARRDVDGKEQLREDGP